MHPVVGAVVTYVEVVDEAVRAVATEEAMHPAVEVRWSRTHTSRTACLPRSKSSSCTPQLKRRSCILQTQRWSLASTSKRRSCTSRSERQK